MTPNKDTLEKLDEILDKHWHAGVSSGQMGRHVGGKPGDEARTALYKLLEAEIQTLNAHLAYMAGQYEGITGKKSAYLLKNWAGYALIDNQGKENNE